AFTRVFDALWRHPGPAPLGRCTQVNALRDSARLCLTRGIAGPILRRDIPDFASLIRATCCITTTLESEFLVHTGKTYASARRSTAARNGHSKAAARGPISEACPIALARQ